jgi:hypothetical protein
MEEWRGVDVVGGELGTRGEDAGIHECEERESPRNHSFPSFFFSQVDFFGEFFFFLF